MVCRYFVGHDVEERGELVCMASLGLLKAKLEDSALQLKSSMVYGSEASIDNS